jgi:hypothetical protein
MVWLLTRAVVWPVKASAGSVKLGYKTGRLFGYRRIFVFGLGVGVGLLLAPMTGAALRARIMAMIEGDVPNDPVPAESPVGRGPDRKEQVVDLDLTRDATS